MPTISERESLERLNKGRKALLMKETDPEKRKALREWIKEAEVRIKMLKSTADRRRHS